MNTTRKSKKAPEIDEQKVNMALQHLENKVDLEGSARYSGALSRRREIKTALNLLRFAITYCLKDQSLDAVGLWGTAMGWGSLCKSGIHKRLAGCQKWIGMLIVLMLLANKLSIPKMVGKRPRLIDASVVSRPGSKKANWRMHLSFDLSHGQIDEVKLTDYKVGETLTNFEFGPDDICLADRCYGVARSLGVLFGSLAYFVIRIGWQNLPLQDWEGQPYSISAWLRVQSTDPAAAPSQVNLWVKTPQGRFPIRLIARAIPPEKAQKIRENLQREGKKKKHTPDERSLVAAGYVMVVSNLPENTWTARQILDLYRFRWQVELVFKRLKGILQFDHLRARDPEMAQVYLLTKILIALLLCEFQWSIALADQDAFMDTEHPVSLWRLNQTLLEAFQTAVCGSLTWSLITKIWDKLDRYLCDSRRRRLQQFANRPDFGAIYGF